ncbi:MAG: thioredoxin family protein [Candidatus Aenigmarchaeota archaeon]|nr:thioredoxin family protein [Candidatus Aenigmarchaeota archaeon]MCK5322270.1 thioredoxin family protein [Candidatus Aenigmarchaeota archaeon]
MKVKIFWKNACPSCPPAKILGRQLTDQGIDVTYHNIDELDGLTESLAHNIMATPSIVVTDRTDKEIKSWRGSVPQIDEIRSL